MKNKKIIYWVVAAVVAVVALLVAFQPWHSIWGSSENAKASEITAVYMTTGDIYFGKMDWFPWPRLKNVWYIQRGVDQKQQPQVGLAPFKDIFWTPIDEVYLNPKEIVFWTRVKDGTQLAEALKNPEAFKQSQANTQPSAQSSGTVPGAGFKGPNEQPPTR